VAARVHAARGLQAARAAGTGALANADLDGEQVRTHARPDQDGARLLASAMDRLGLTGRGHDRILRVARTLADLEGLAGVAARHVAEALQFRRCAGDT
jgi:magnesium chelatase family protein